MHKWLVILHVIGAAIWIGGHLILCLRYLPEAIKSKNVEIIKKFESKFEPIGLPALVMQIITGIWLVWGVYNTSLWGFSNTFQTTVSIKIILMAITILLAIHARLFIIPKLSPQNLNLLALHIVAVTLIGILFLYVGVSYRFGGI